MTVNYAYEKRYKLGGDREQMLKDIGLIWGFLYQVQNSDCGEICFSTKFIEQLENLYICKPSTCEEDKLDCNIVISFPEPKECVELTLRRVQ